MNRSYTQLGTIDSLTDAVNSLAFSGDGRYLASASDDKTVRVHDIKRRFSLVWQHRGRCPFTAVAWREDVLFIGNFDGEVMCAYPITNRFYRPKNEIIHEAYAPIAYLQFDGRGKNMLVCTGPEVLLLKRKNSGQWKYKDHLPRPGPFGETEGYDEPPTLATGAHFLASENECLVSYLHNGFWRCKIDTWETTCTWGPDEKIGFSAVSPDSTSVIATNMRSGLDWFRILPENLNKISTSIEIQELGCNVPMPVLFINKGQAALMGTSKGYAVIFDAKQGRRLQALKHGGDKTWVTALSYIGAPNSARLIATGDGNSGEHTKIRIWQEDDDDAPIKLSNFRFSLPRLVKFFTSMIGMIFFLMGIIFAIDFLAPTEWKEAVAGRISAVSWKPFPPSLPSLFSSPSELVTSSPPELVTSSPPAPSSPLEKAARKIEDLIMFLS